MCRIKELLQFEEFESNQVLYGLAILIDHILETKLDQCYLTRAIQGL